MKKKSFSVAIVFIVGTMLLACYEEIFELAPEVNLQSVVIENDASRFKATVVVEKFPTTFKDTFEDFDDAAYGIMMTIDENEDNETTGDFGLGVACSEDYIDEQGGTVDISEFSDFCSGALVYKVDAISFLYIPTNLLELSINQDRTTFILELDYSVKEQLKVNSAAIEKRLDSLEEKFSSLGDIEREKASQLLTELRAKVPVLVNGYNGLIDSIDQKLSEKYAVAFYLETDYFRDALLTFTNRAYTKDY